MKNILLIFKQEYLTRVSKKSFIVMTLLGPLLIALFYGSIGAVAYFGMKKDSKTIIAINDKHNVFNQHIDSSKKYTFEFVNNVAEAKQKIENETIDALLLIENAKGDSIHLITKNALSITEKSDLNEILSKQLFNDNLKQNGLTSSKIDSLKVEVNFVSNSLNGKSSATEMPSAIGYIGAFIIYIFIFMYGVMIMRGVTEEKNSRIVEIIVSAVKPFELMMGKILGVALVGLTQFVAWIVLTGILTSVLAISFGLQHTDTQALVQVQNTGKSAEILKMVSELFFQLQGLNLGKIIFGFMVFFFGGFLLYSSLFAAIGSAVDSDTETQQFMFPVSMPLIFGLIIAQMTVINDPNGTLATICSMVPFTSPVVMMVRLPFDVSWGELFLSAFILFATFIFTVWLAAKIYRIGILSYGQKASYKQMWKWLRMKN